MPGSQLPCPELFSAANSPLLTWLLVFFSRAVDHGKGCFKVVEPGYPGCFLHHRLHLFRLVHGFQKDLREVVEVDTDGLTTQFDM